MLELLFCHVRCCFSWYNPIYVILFITIYLLTFPGAAVHWLLLPIVPVRKFENPEERELRSQGVYTAIGVAIWSLPFAALGLYYGDSLMQLINKISLLVNSSIILFNLIGLKAMADELITSIRIFSVGAFVIVLFLIGLALFDVYEYFTSSWIFIVSYVFRLIQIFVYTVIVMQCMQLWNMYEQSKVKQCLDVGLSIMLVLLLLAIITGFLVAIIIAEDKAWRIMFW